jgi:hypothetical protein
MKTKGFWIFSVLVTALLGVLGGCGGGSGSSSGPVGGGNVSVPLYATDAPSPNFRNVWVTIYGISLTNSAGASVQAFTDSAGLTVDVRSLRDSSGQLFEFLNSSNVPSATYKSATILVSNTVNIVTAGSTSSQSYQFANANSGGAGMTALAVTFKNNFTANGTNPVVLDFDLSNWAINAQNQVSASVSLAYGANVSATGRQMDRPVQGAIQDLSGSVGNQTFVLVHDGSQLLQVQTNSSTTITNGNGSANPTLSDAENVFLTGTVVNGAFVADSITIINATSVPPNLNRFVGTFSNVNATAGTFTLAVQTCMAAVSSVQLTVDTSSKTTFNADGIGETQADFFAQLAKNPNATLQVFGTVSGSTLTATQVSIGLPKGPGGGTHLVAEIGTATDVNPTAGTFTLSINSWFGGPQSNGQSVSVVTNTSTTYNLNGTNVSEATFFAGLNNTKIAAIGTLSNGTLTAITVIVGANPISIGGSI